MAYSLQLPSVATNTALPRIGILIALSSRAKGFLFRWEQAQQYQGSSSFRKSQSSAVHEKIQHVSTSPTQQDYESSIARTISDASSMERERTAITADEISSFVADPTKVLVRILF